MKLKFLKLTIPFHENPESSQPTTIEYGQEVLAKPEEYKCGKCPKNTKQHLDHGRHVKSKHYHNLHCDQCISAFVYHTQLKAYNRIIPSIRNGCAPTMIVSKH